jgi:hypothetical protein
MEKISKPDNFLSDTGPFLHKYSPFFFRQNERTDEKEETDTERTSTYRLEISRSAKSVMY